MGRPVTLFTAQFSDMPFDDLCKLAQKCGYDGLEVATFGGYLDIEKAAEDQAYCDALKAKMAKAMKMARMSRRTMGTLTPMKWEKWLWWVRMPIRRKANMA